jgi:isoleucyl-tRNA synthetase
MGRSCFPDRGEREVPGYRPVDPKVDLPAVERDILVFWEDARIFQKTLELRKDAPEWVFYEGPPTANARPHIGHALTRTFKDIFPRFKTMTGHFVLRKGGWDCHGLPVELEIEREIGTKSKRDIEAFGIAEFNRLCRQSVTRYVEDWERLTARIGFWIDLSDAYWTMNPEYVESVWWSLKELHRQGLLFEDDNSVAYCPRCGTALSDHEVAQGYTTVVDPSVFVKFRIVEAADPSLVGSSIVAWTTTPWTLPSNLGLAVDPRERYVVVETDGERLIVAERLRTAVFGDQGTDDGRIHGHQLVGARYEGLYPNVEGDVYRVVEADFVSMEEGTGIVHIAPGFGAEDLEVGRREGWPAFNPLDDYGRFTDQTPVEWIRGLFVKEADPDITEDLRRRGLLLRAETYRHTYPLCWRCDTPLLYMSRTSWYVRTTERKERLLEVNEAVNWYPDHIKHGRYGDWLQNNVDWALSRERYWGTPLPVWRCPNKHVVVVGSLKELSELAGRDVTGVDPHRPDIDEVTVACPACGEESRRVPEVIDTWYDSGAMPYAQWGYHPDLGRGEEAFRKRFPADFIAEAIDQTRGWFYSLMAEATLLFDETAYRNVVCFDLILDEHGRKMSKRLGNVVDPMEVMERVGADALRWYLLTSGSPWTSRRLSLPILDEVVRHFLLTLWNVYAFFVTYANADGFDASEHHVPPGDRPLLDRWILSQLARTVAEARDGLERYDPTGAGRRIARFVDDLSNWYVRRARRRFWDPARPQEAREKAAAFLTLYESLVTVSQLLAPFTPFIAEAMWRNMVAGRDGRPESVHLSDYPEADPALVDDALDEGMRTAREMVELGRRIRNDARVKVRQPLRRALVHHGGDPSSLEPFLSLVAEELNVREVVFSESAEELAAWRARPNFKVLGPRLGSNVKRIARALAEDDGSMAADLARGESIAIAVDETFERIDPGDVDLIQETRSGWGAAAEGGLTLALDLEVTPDLRLEGLARDVVRLVQDARKAAGLEVSDRIELAVEASGEVAEAVASHREWIAGEVLAIRMEEGPGRAWEDARRERAELDGIEVGIALRRAT